MLIEIRPGNPDDRSLAQVAEYIEGGGIAIIPTDTVYAFVCLLSDSENISKLAHIKGKSIKQAEFSVLCKDLSSLSEFCPSITNPVFRLMKQVLPGPFTFILPAGHKIPGAFRKNKKTIGLRVPDNAIAQGILSRLKEPLVSTSVPNADPVSGFMTDPWEMNEKFGKQVAVVVDGGAGGKIPSTVLDCTSGTPELIRQGKGQLES